MVLEAFDPAPRSTAVVRSRCWRRWSRRCRAWPPGSLHVERYARSRAPALARRSSSCWPVHGERWRCRGASRSCTRSRRRACRCCRRAGRARAARVRPRCWTASPDHRDPLLSEEERAACDTMMICVSRGRGRRLVSTCRRAEHRSGCLCPQGYDWIRYAHLGIHIRMVGMCSSGDHGRPTRHQARGFFPGIRSRTSIFLAVPAAGSASTKPISLGSRPGEGAGVPSCT